MRNIKWGNTAFPQHNHANHIRTNCQVLACSCLNKMGCCKHLRIGQHGLSMIQNTTCSWQIACMFSKSQIQFANAKRKGKQSPDVCPDRHNRAIKSHQWIAFHAGFRQISNPNCRYVEQTCLQLQNWNLYHYPGPIYIYIYISMDQQPCG